MTVQRCHCCNPKLGLGGFERASSQRKQSGESACLQSFTRWCNMASISSSWSSLHSKSEVQPLDVLEEGPELRKRLRGDTRDCTSNATCKLQTARNHAKRLSEWQQAVTLSVKKQFKSAKSRSRVICITRKRGDSRGSQTRTRRQD